MSNQVPTESKNQSPWLTQPVCITDQVWPEEAVPVVSICCITYNHEKFIRECLGGFLMQETTFPVEILIHDDASTDGTADVIREYEAKYPHIIKPIYQTENQYSKRVKPNLTFNYPRAKGKYIALCEGDDYWTDPLKLQKQVDFLEGNEEYAMCYHGAKMIDENGNILHESFLPCLYKKELSSEELMKIAKIPLLTVCFRNIVDSFPEEMYDAPGPDRFLVILIGRYGKGKYLETVQPSVYRKHSGGVWSGITKTQQVNNYIKTRMLIYQYYEKIGLKDYSHYCLFNEIFPMLRESCHIARLYLDDGSEYKEVGLNCFSNYQSNYCVDFSLPMKGKQLKFEPIEGAGCKLTINSITYKKDEDNEEKYDLLLLRHNGKYDGNCIVFHTLKPQVLIPINNDISNIRINYDLEIISANAVEVIIRKQLNQIYHSWTYKIGRAFAKPIEIVLKLFRVNKK